MNRQLIKRIVAFLLAAALILGLLPVLAFAEEAENPQVIVGDSEAKSIGIIGGADGPTAIFITGNWDGIVSTLLLIAGGICGVIAFAGFLKKRRK